MVAGLAISNIAWAHSNFLEALQLADELELDGIEVAPHNVFGRWDVPPEEVRDLRSRIEEKGMACPALQGILFAVPEARLFESSQSRAILKAHLTNVARMAGLLGAKACVFGAPRQRDPGDLPEEEAIAIARDFFASVAPAFADHGSALAIEANARIYGCRFLITTSEAIDFVRSVDTPGIALQLDTGTMFLEAEAPEIMNEALALAAHAHVSEPHLLPIGSGGTDHEKVSAAFKSADYEGFLSIEMKASNDWQGAIRKAVSLVRAQYL
jgi:sugar phosphate isomerase/epimerase